MVHSAAEGGRCTIARSDASSLNGLRAVLGKYLMDRPVRYAELSRGLGQRLAPAGVAVAEPDEQAVRQAVNDLNQRLRYALGEYPDPPDAVGVPLAPG